MLPCLRMHRPASIGSKDFEQLPVSLLDPILAQVEEDCAHAEPDARDTDFACQLISEMSADFKKEDERMRAFWELCQEDLDIHFEAHAVRTDCLTDGTALCFSGVSTAAYANLEVKVDMGSGGNPRIQNGASVALFYCDDNRQRLRELCRCPTLMLELAGPNLSLSGFAYGEYCCCDQLSHTVPLLWQPKSELMLSAARVVYAIRKAKTALQVMCLLITHGCSSQLLPGIQVALHAHYVA